MRLKDRGHVENFDFQRLNVSGVSLGSARFLDGFYVLTIAPDRDAFQIASALQASGRFDVLEFDAIGKRHRTPSDPWYSQQWNLPKIQMPQAWNITTGSSSIILGVIDSGTRYTHEDLDGNIWVNSAEDRNGNGRPDFIPVAQGGDLDGIDNDGNGFVDDLIGWDFAGGGNNPQPPFSPDNNPDDTDGHGTNVAGISSAQTHNLESGSYRGIAGVAGGWGTQKGVSLMVLRDGGFNPFLSLTAQAIEYAARNGARAINISSGWGPTEPNLSVLQSAVNFAVNTHGVVIVASAGNNGATGDPSIRFPARYSNTIAVGATDQNDNRRSYSAHGPEMDVVAPDGVPSTTMAGGYTSQVFGTSFSAPHVAGLAALIRSVNPSLTWQQVRDILRNSVDKVPAMGGNNFTNEYGYGRINAHRALAPPPPPQNLVITNAGQAGQSPNLSWNAVSGATSYNIYRGTIQGAPGTVNCNMVPVYSLAGSTTSTSYVDGAVIMDPNSNVLVCYYVTAVNQVGESSGSNRVGVHGTAPLKMADLSRFLGQSIQMVPEVFSISQNFPNPFNPETEISFGLPEPSDVTITIIDLLGRDVATVASGHYSAGYRRVRWDGVDANGNKVGSGMYFYRITAIGESGKQFSKVMKLLLLK